MCLVSKRALASDVSAKDLHGNKQSDPGQGEGTTLSATMYCSHVGRPMSASLSEQEWQSRQSDERHRGERRRTVGNGQKSFDGSSLVPAQRQSKPRGQCWNRTALADSY